MTFWLLGLPRTYSVRVLVERNGAPGLRTLSAAATMSPAGSACAAPAVANMAAKAIMTELAGFIDLASDVTEGVDHLEPGGAGGGRDGCEGGDKGQACPGEGGERPGAEEVEL